MDRNTDFLLAVLARVLTNRHLQKPFLCLGISLKVQSFYCMLIIFRTAAKVIMDIDTGVSRGFGFVSFGDEDDATAAMRMDGQELAGRLIRVNSADSIGTAARKKAPRGRT
ncbi:hypothetical protein QQ045_025788 [Rhodiola kirilowii]